MRKRAVAAAFVVVVLTGCASARRVPVGSTASAAVTTSASIATTSTTLAPATTTTTQPRPMAKVVFNRPTSEPVVYVTIDDGFTRDPRVATFLATHHWPVSAFVIGHVAAQAPGYFRTLHDNGATIDDHTSDHPNLRGRSFEEQRAQICGGRDTIESRVGATPRLFRPPYGEYDDTTRAAARDCGFDHIVAWNATMHDGKLDVVGHQPFHNGDIVLLHFVPSLFDDLNTLDAIFRLEHLRVASLDDALTGER